MDYKMFANRLQQWPQLHFTATELQQREITCEIYATAAEHQTMSQLFICRVSDEKNAQELIRQYRSWLHKFNLGRSRRDNSRPPRSVSVNVPGAISAALK